MKAIATTTWKVLNLAPTGAALLVDKTGASDRVKSISYWTGWTIDWMVPGLPVGSGLVAIVAATVILTKKVKG